MDKIRAVLNTLFDAEMYEDEDCSEGIGFDANGNGIYFCAVAPHEGTDNKWMVRAGLQRDFDRWSNSTQWEEFFDTEDEAARYIETHVPEIYAALKCTAPV